MGTSEAHLAPQESNYWRPLSSAKLVDPLLEDAQPSQWTSVSSNDRLLRNILESYFVNQYPRQFFFVKNYLLEDMSYYYFKPPCLLDIPADPLPDVDGRSEWYGQMSLRYPPDEQTYSPEFAHSMKALCELRVIQNEIGVMCFSRSKESRKMPWGAALHIQAKLEACFEAYDSTLTIFLAQLANLTLEPLEQLERDPGNAPPEVSESLLSTLVLCFGGLYEQSKSAYIAGIMLMIMRKRLSADVRNAVGRYVSIEETDSDTDPMDETDLGFSHPILSELILPGTSLSDDPKSWRLKNLVDDPRRYSG
ncbi:uncharacterized protein J4E79_004391 [Alternaria viburni]|uniref:uncharacterized protein n=1 Tax=Alternaria viburni TaxID=566460 RepID=UPI0020C2489D|nr:uncharacterized protein J4E79_004391 [Alternaria viburni]KAI4663077.1 hypothetical protein J4E79_004391 [Alternaria viburni]